MSTKKRQALHTKKYIDIDSKRVGYLNNIYNWATSMNIELKN